MRTNRKYKNLSFTFDEWQRIEKYSAECNLKTATYIKQMALNGKVISINMREYHEIISVITKNIMGNAIKIVPIFHLRFF